MSRCQPDLSERGDRFGSAAFSVDAVLVAEPVGGDHCEDQSPDCDLSRFHTGWSSECLMRLRLNSVRNSCRSICSYDEIAPDVQLNCSAASGRDFANGSFARLPKLFEPTPDIGSQT